MISHANCYTVAVAVIVHVHDRTFMIIVNTRILYISMCVIISFVMEWRIFWCTRNIRYFKRTSFNNRFADITPLSLRCMRSAYVARRTVHVESENKHARNSPTKHYSLNCIRKSFRENYITIACIDKCDEFEVISFWHKNCLKLFFCLIYLLIYSLLNYIFIIFRNNVEQRLKLVWNWFLLTN